MYDGDRRNFYGSTGIRGDAMRRATFVLFALLASFQGIEIIADSENAAKDDSLQKVHTRFHNGEIAVGVVIKQHLTFFKAELSAANTTNQRIQTHRRRVKRLEQLLAIVEKSNPNESNGDRSIHIVKNALDVALVQLTGVVEANRHKWIALKPVSFKLPKDDSAQLLKDDSVLFKSPGPKGSLSRFIFRPASSQFTHLRFEAMNDASLPKKGPGRSADGRFLIFAINVYHVSAGQQKYVEIRNAYTDHEDSSNPVEAAKDFLSDTCWIAPTSEFAHEPVTAVFEFWEPLKLGTGDHLEIVLDAGHNDQRTPGRVRFSIASTPNPKTANKNGKR